MIICVWLYDHIHIWFGKNTVEPDPQINAKEKEVFSLTTLKVNKVQERNEWVERHTEESGAVGSPIELTQENVEIKTQANFNWELAKSMGVTCQS